MKISLSLTQSTVSDLGFGLERFAGIGTWVVGLGFRACEFRERDAGLTCESEKECVCEREKKKSCSHIKREKETDREGGGRHHEVLGADAQQHRVLAAHTRESQRWAGGG